MKAYSFLPPPTKLSLPLSKNNAKISPRRLSPFIIGVQLCAGILATLVYFLFFALFGSLALLVWAGEMLAIVLVPLNIALIWCMAPRFYGYPPDIVLADHKQFPILNETVRQIATLVGVVPPALLIAECHDAGFARLGLRRRGVIMVGHSLFSILTMKETLLVLAHEVAHAADRAFTRSFYVRVAYGMLLRWNRLFDPMRLRGWQRLLLPIALVMWVILRPLYLQLRSCISLDHQAAELWADDISVQIVGSSDVTELFYKLTLKHNTRFVDAYKGAALDQKYDVVRQLLADFPEGIRKRVAEYRMMQPTARFASHPRFTERIERQRLRGKQLSRLSLNSRRFAALHAELKAWPRIMRMREATL